MREGGPEVQKCERQPFAPREPIDEALELALRIEKLLTRALTEPKARDHSYGARLALALTRSLTDQLSTLLKKKAA
jgi:hypothetical protein